MPESMALRMQRVAAAASLWPRSPRPRAMRETFTPAVPKLTNCEASRRAGV